MRVQRGVHALIIGLVASLCALLYALALSPPAQAMLPPKHWGVVNHAQRCLGAPYLAGGATPEGFDEAGLVSFTYAQIGIATPRDVAGLLTAGREVDESQRQPGDVMIWAEDDLSQRAGIYVGGGAVICAGGAGNVVRYEVLDPAQLLTMRRLGSYTGTQAVVLARRQLGIPFRAGGQDRQGFNAAGLTRFVYGKLGVWLPARIGEQAYLGRAASLRNLKRGDLVFWGSPDQARYWRVGVYAGRGRVICATRAAGRVVEVPLGRAVRARRLLPIL